MWTARGVRNTVFFLSFSSLPLPICAWHFLPTLTPNMWTYVCKHSGQLLIPWVLLLHSGGPDNGGCNEGSISLGILPKIRLYKHLKLFFCGLPVALAMDAFFIWNNRTFSWLFASWSRWKRDFFAGRSSLPENALSVKLSLRTPQVQE